MHIVEDIYLTKEEVESLLLGLINSQVEPEFLMQDFIKHQVWSLAEYFKQNTEHEIDFAQISCPIKVKAEYQNHRLKRHFLVEFHMTTTPFFNYEPEENSVAYSYMMKDFYLTDIIFYDAYTGENLQAWMQKRFVILQGEREIEVNSLSWYADYNLPQVTQNMVSFVSEAAYDTGLDQIVDEVNLRLRQAKTVN